MPRESKQDWGTPPEFLSAVKRLLGVDEFAVDLAAHADNAVAPIWFGPGGAREDSLSPDASWSDGYLRWLWLNPPYADIAPWVEKAAAEAALGARIAVLVPLSADANWWADHVEGKARALAVAPRLQFVGAKDPYPKPIALLLYDEAGGSGIHQWRWKARKR